jgi:hypothetical protein
VTGFIRVREWSISLEKIARRPLGLLITFNGGHLIYGDIGLDCIGTKLSWMREIYLRRAYWLFCLKMAEYLQQSCPRQHGSWFVGIRIKIGIWRQLWICDSSNWVVGLSTCNSNIWAIWHKIDKIVTFINFLILVWMVKCPNSSSLGETRFMNSLSQVFSPTELSSEESVIKTRPSYIHHYAMQQCEGPNWQFTSWILSVTPSVKQCLGGVNDDSNRLSQPWSIRIICMLIVLV